MSGFQRQSDPRKRFQLLDKIGQGGYGYVCKAWDNEENKMVAVKIINLEEAGEDVDAVNAEITVMSNVNCSKLTKYYASCVVDSNLWIIMEYLEAGSLLEIIKETGPLDEQTCCYVLYELFTALKYLHAERKIHRDVKAGNLLVSARGEVKLADFGVTGQLTDSMDKRKTQVGTPFWMAPEVITQSLYDGCADIWSAGITAIELATGMPPYAKKVHPMQVIFLIPKSPPPVLDGEFSAEFKDFVACCLKKNPAERPSAAELLLHPFLQNAPVSGASPAWKEKVATRVGTMDGGSAAADPADSAGAGGATDSVPDMEATLKSTATVTARPGSAADDASFGVDCSEEGWDFTLRSSAPVNAGSAHTSAVLSATSKASNASTSLASGGASQASNAVSQLSTSTFAAAGKDSTTPVTSLRPHLDTAAAQNESAPPALSSPQLYTTIDEKSMKSYSYEDTPPDANNAGTHYASVVGMNFHPPVVGRAGPKLKLSGPPGSSTYQPLLSIQQAQQAQQAQHAQLQQQTMHIPPTHSHSPSGSSTSSLPRADMPPKGRPSSKEFATPPLQQAKSSRSRSISESSPLDFGLCMSSASSSYDDAENKASSLLNVLSKSTSGDVPSPAYADYWQNLRGQNSAASASFRGIVNGVTTGATSNPMLAEAAALTSTLQAEVDALRRKVDALEHENEILKSNAKKKSLNLNLDDGTGECVEDRHVAAAAQGEHLPDLDQQIQQFVRICARAHSRAHVSVSGHCTAQPATTAAMSADSVAVSAGEAGGQTEASSTLPQAHPCAHSRLYSAAIAPVIAHLHAKVQEMPRGSGAQSEVLADLLSVLGTTLCALDLVDAPQNHFALSTTAATLGGKQVSPRAGTVAKSSSGGRPPAGSYSTELMTLICAHMYEELEGNM